MDQLYGLYGTVTIEGVTFHHVKWSCKFNHREVDATTTYDQGWEHPVNTIASCSGTIECIWDSAIQGESLPKPFSRTPGSFVLRGGASDSDIGFSITFEGIANNCTIDSDQADVLRYSFDYKSVGAVTYAHNS